MSKRYGAGSVFQRPDLKWIAQWELPPGPEGRRRRRQLVRESEAAAQQAMNRARGRSSSKSRRSTGEDVGAFLDRWLADVVATTRRERTLIGYRAIVERSKLDIGSIDLAKLTSHDVQAMLNRLGRAPQTVRHYAACLRSAFGYAVRRNLIATNPAIDLDLPALSRTDRIPLSIEELRTFLDATRDEPLGPLWQTAAWTGMRQGELLGLRWQDVDTERGTIIVRRSLARLPGPKGIRYVLTEPKTASSRRTVPLVPEVAETLRAMRKVGLAAEPDPGKLDQGLVFATEAGSPLDGPWVTHRFVQALARAGVRRVRMHDLRHGAATMLIQRGVDLATVGAILGHSNIGTTVDIYGHLTQSHKVAAMARLTDVG